MVKIMRDGFDRAFPILLVFEGETVNNPKDPGGLTKYGISQKAYPDEDIMGLTKERAKEIYKRDYWDKGNCDSLPSPLDIIYFDTAVNCGLGAASAILGRSGRDPMRFLLKRIEYYIGLTNKNHNLNAFIKGWINRVIKLFNLVG